MAANLPRASRHCHLAAVTTGEREPGADCVTLNNAALAAARVGRSDVRRRAGVAGERCRPIAHFEYRLDTGGKGRRPRGFGALDSLAISVIADL
jgi:hypothetical protein